jgi:hypothetical protein
MERMPVKKREFAIAGTMHVLGLGMIVTILVRSIFAEFSVPHRLALYTVVLLGMIAYAVLCFARVPMPLRSRLVLLVASGTVLMCDAGSLLW